ncbi:unnamed protein product [Dimorphilus gyrociliatus]|uniref:G protein-regulated inducer of neurite outgrowth C-terminal domain-containing protein n=1 Tax=Dimorphilus gyrociliatus TaxID=2664684 RepID=A0A7I8VQC5_9ANNE|nr:unnamed protein product [Dimorphilus gyrociliatus]
MPGDARRKRFLYQRSQTLPAEDAGESLLERGEEKELRKPSGSIRRTQFKQRRSITLSEAPVLRPNDSQRTSSRTTPTELFHKMRDKIQQKLFQTEWPNAAVIVEDRRQRALEALEASIGAQETPQTSKKELIWEKIELKEVSALTGAKYKYSPTKVPKSDLPRPKSCSEDPRPKMSQSKSDFQPSTSSSSPIEQREIILDAKAQARLQSEKSIPDVVFDDHGQTWDVYGAEFDPEILGQAIQNHLRELMNGKEEKKQERSRSQGFWFKLFCLFRQTPEEASA